MIIVGNVSTNSNFEVIKKYVNKHKGDVKVKVIRNNKNLGYAGA